MNDNKYYTPELSEFCEGFEYEVQIPEKQTWSKEVFHFNESHINLIKYVALQNEHTKNKIRVKRLDSQDIESEGWEKQINMSTEFTSAFTKVINEVKYFIFFWPHDGRLLIHKEKADTWGNPHPNVFIGTLKNRHELSRLMKQLGNNNLKTK